MAKTITVNLRNKLVKLHTTRRRAKAFDYLREIVGKQEHVEPAAVKLDGSVNEFVFKYVYKKFKPLKLTVDKIGDQVRVKMVESKKPAPAAAQPAKTSGTSAKAGTTPAAVKNTEKTPQAKKQEKIAKEATKAQPKRASTPGANTTQPQTPPPTQ